MLFAQLVLFAQDAVEAVKDGAAKGGGEGPPPWNMLPLLILLFAALYFIVILPSQRKEKKQRAALFSALKKNDEVVTAGGIIGIVQMVKDDEVTLKIDDNAKMRVLKSSITRIIPKDAPATTPT